MGLIWLAVSSACDPGADITWVNDTSHQVRVYFSDDLNAFATSVPPNSSGTWGFIEGDWTGIVVVRDEQLNILLREEITWDELKARGFRFVITEEVLWPTPSPAR